MRYLFAVVVLVLVLVASMATADVPGMINYQGVLTDGTNPLSGTYVVTFSIYADSTGGSPYWTESQTVTTDAGGAFSVILGDQYNPFPPDLWQLSAAWLGIAVGADPEISPRTRFTTMPYAFVVETVDGATGGHIEGNVNIEGNVTIGYNNTNTGDTSFVAGASCDGSNQGVTISGGLNNDAAGLFAAIAGGWYALADGAYSSVGGGRNNRVTGDGSVIPGGWVGNVDGNFSAVGGGAENEVDGWYASVSGGYKNQVMADYSAILGGEGDTITETAHHSYLFGMGSKLTQDSTFMVDLPHILFGDETTGYEFPPSDGSAGQVLATNGAGQLSWTTGGSGGGGGWTDDGAVVRLDTDADEVGVGTTTPEAKLHVEAGQPHAAMFTTTAGATDSGIIHAEYLGTDAEDVVGVYAHSKPQDYWGIGGRFEGGYRGIEAYALPDAVGTYYYEGVHAEAMGGLGTNRGVSARAGGPNPIGVEAIVFDGNGWATGVSGWTISTTANNTVGVEGRASGTGEYNYGVAGYTEDSSANYNIAVFGRSSQGVTMSVGVEGIAEAAGDLKYGGAFYGSGSGSENIGVVAHANSATINRGVSAAAWGGTSNYAIYGSDLGMGSAPTHYAGYFAGDVHVNGTLSKTAGSFRIDHPLDPENKYLQHSFVESPDMMNVYNGNVVTDDQGRAVVEMPDYFEALNRDFRYQLTVIGQFAQAIVGEKIDHGRFTILTDKPNVEVSWQVTGIRNDPWAQAHRIEVEVDKLPFEQGRYQNPELYGADKSRATVYFEDEIAVPEKRDVTLSDRQGGKK